MVPDGGGDGPHGLPGGVNHGQQDHSHGRISGNKYIEFIKSLK